MEQLVGEIVGEAPDPRNLAAMTAIFGVWNAARGANALPRRQDLRPEQLRPWMPQLSLLKWEPELEDWVYTLQGNDIVEHAYGNLTNQRLGSVAATPELAEMRAQILRCAETKQPCWFFNVPSMFRDYARIDKIELPFGQDGVVTHILIALFRNPPVGDFGPM